MKQGAASSASQDEVQPGAHEAMAALEKLGVHMKSTWVKISENGGTIILD